MCEFKIIKLVPKGEYIKRNETTQKVYIRGEYCRELKAYECIDTDDINHQIYIKSNKPVYVGFTY